MRLAGAQRVPAGADALWRALSEPERLAAALPDVDLLDVEEDGAAFTALVRPATGLGTSPLRMAFRIAEQRPGEYVRIAAAGGAAETAIRLDLEATLAERDGGTDVSWRADVALLGVVGSVAQRVLPQLADRQVNAVLRAAATA